MTWGGGPSIPAIAGALILNGNETYTDDSGAQTLTQNVWVQLSNDAAGAETQTEFALPDATGMWDEVADEIDFEAGMLILGDICTIRVDVAVITTSPNTAVAVRLSLGVGDAFEYTLEFDAAEVRSAGTKAIVRYIPVTMDNNLTLQNPCIIEMITDSTGDSVVVNGWKFLNQPRMPHLAS